MAKTKHLIIGLICMGCGLAATGFASGAVDAGFLYDEFSLTLAPGHRTEILGPLFYSQQSESEHQWAVPPLGFSHTLDPVIDYEEYDFAYPLMTYDRFGEERRWQFFQVLSLAGGKNPDDTSDRRFTVFPIYFQQRSSQPGQDYTAFFPFYGRLKHRLFRDDIDFVLFPSYSRTRKKDVVTFNMPYPFFHLRYGDHLRGWQAWPLMGHEHKGATTQTNDYGETQAVGGYDSRFVLWPFFTCSTNDTETNNPVRQSALIPFYSLYRSKRRDSFSCPWPLGMTHTVEREKKFEEWDAPWPLVEFTRGEGKTVRRVWPFFSRGRSQYVRDDWYCWPVYKYNRVTSAPLDRERTRILFFLYSHVDEKNTESGRAFERHDLWPLFTRRREFNGDTRLQIFSLMEPLFPNNKSVERDYAQLYSLWRSEWNPSTRAASQSLLWNLYRRETAPRMKKISLLFGLFQYQSTPEGGRWRICHVPTGKADTALPNQTPGH